MLMNFDFAIVSTEVELRSEARIELLDDGRCAFVRMCGGMLFGRVAERSVHRMILLAPSYDGEYEGIWASEEGMSVEVGIPRDGKVYMTALPYTVQPFTFEQYEIFRDVMGKVGDDSLIAEEVMKRVREGKSAPHEIRWKYRAWLCPIWVYNAVESDERLLWVTGEREFYVGGKEKVIGENGVICVGYDDAQAVRGWAQEQGVPHTEVDLVRKAHWPYVRVNDGTRHGNLWYVPTMERIGS